MKVSDRIKQIQGIVKNGTNIEAELIQLEVEIVSVIQAVSEEAYRIGYDEGYDTACREGHGN